MPNILFVKYHCQTDENRTQQRWKQGQYEMVVEPH